MCCATSSKNTYVCRERGVIRDRVMETQLERFINSFSRGLDESEMVRWRTEYRVVVVRMAGRWF